ncbi:MAG TPA: ferrochelatase [Myxococcales bacterium]|nr:ferrochelatase [Myxococcales bacterium]
MSTAVFLMNLGGPRDLAEVRPYLYELFSDPRILRMPAVARLPLAFLISTLRAPSSRAKYALIGGGSPLVRETQAQADALARALGSGFSCHLAMRCGHPSTREAVEEALASGAERAVALSLYPQLAGPTTGSSLQELERWWPKERPLAKVLHYGDEPRFVRAAAACLSEALARLTGDQSARRLVVFSAHGLPMRDIEAGDPYEGEVQASCRALAAAVNLADEEWILTYQSRVRPREWLGPDTVKTLAARAKGRAVVAVPVAFVSEHLETLYDLDVLARQAAESAGAVTFVRAAAPGVRGEFIEALASYVREALAGSVARAGA